MMNNIKYNKYTIIQILYALRHPVTFIKEFKYESDFSISLQYKICNTINYIYKRFPFQKPCRWLCNMLVLNVYNAEYLDTFISKVFVDKNHPYQKNKIYYAKGFFGYVRFYEEIKGNTKLIYSGWVFTKKQAFKTFKQVVLSNPNIFKGKEISYPECYQPFYMEHVLDMEYILKHNKMRYEDYIIKNTLLEDILKKSNNPYVKLWVYVTDLLMCHNDFDAKDRLIEIESECTYYINLIKCKKTSYNKEEIIEIKNNIKNYLSDLKDYYLSKEYNYYRV